MDWYALVRWSTKAFSNVHHLRKTVRRLECALGGLPMHWFGDNPHVRFFRLLLVTILTGVLLLSL